MPIYSKLVLLPFSLTTNCSIYPIMCHESTGIYYINYYEPYRDIKPENMLVGEKNEILLGDFGIALITQGSRFQPTQDIIGTLPYMSPEQIQGKPRQASDQYSLGIVVYEWLNGGHPFRGSLTELCTQHMFASPPLLHERIPTISPEVEHVVRTALAKDPKQRFESIQAFATVLEKASQYALPTQRSSPLGLSSSLHTHPSAFRPSILLTLPAKTPTSPQQQQPVALSIMDTTPSDRLVLLPESMLQTVSASPIIAKTESKPQASISRRAVLLGVASGLATAMVGISAFATTHKPSSPVTPPPHAPAPTPQNQPFTYRGHSSVIWSVAWSPTSERIVSGSDDHTAQVWNASDGGNVFIYRRHPSSVDVVTCSPDGQFIASGSDDGTVQVWNASDGGNVLIYPGHLSNVNAVAWSPDKQLIASGSVDQTVQVWNVNNGSEVFTYRGHSAMLWGVAWSPDGMRIASCSEDGTVQIWNAIDASNRFTYQGHSSSVFAAAWSPDGKRIASCSADHTVQVWNASDGSNVFTYRGHSNTVRGLSWSPNGQQIASCSEDSTVQVWNARDGSNVFTYRGHSDWVMTVAWAPDGKRIASGSRDSTVQVWHVG
jgi:eukaryotic-like serine/threonine-protein kinase